MWDTRTWDYVAPFLESESEEEDPGMQPYVSFVRINSSLAVAAYEDGEYLCPPPPISEKASPSAIAAAAPSSSEHAHTHIVTHLPPYTGHMYIHTHLCLLTHMVVHSILLLGEESSQ